MNAGKSLGIYLHIPFCKQKCIYCDFYSLARREDQMDAYTAALRRRLEILPADGYTADTIYFGGGTPSYLGPERLESILEAVFRRCFVSPDAEITLEANPDSAGDLAALTQLRRAGFNRVSLGMQSASDRELAMLGRIHTLSQVRASVETVRRAGFDNLSLDLIYGLPGQTLSRWRKNLEEAVSLAPDHLSCYGLKAEKNTPLYDRRHTLPGDGVQADMYLETVSFLAKRGIQQYEISNFARPGRESRHNLKYWTLGEYAGLGPGAHSDFGGVRYAWSRDLDAFLSGDETVSERQTMTLRDREEEWLMLGLRLVQGLDPAAYQERFGRSFAPFAPFLERCRDAGYALYSAGRWRLTPEGFLVSNEIIRELLRVRETLPALPEGPGGLPPGRRDIPSRPG